MVWVVCRGYFCLGLSPVFAPNKAPTCYTKSVPNWYAGASYDNMSCPLTCLLLIGYGMWINKKLLTSPYIGYV